MDIGANNYTRFGGVWDGFNEIWGGGQSEGLGKVWVSENLFAILFQEGVKIDRIGGFTDSFLKGFK
jgi:hypothetical protein